MSPGPDLIPLLYHNNANVRWWAQISLVELTGQNFGPNWKAWGDWWNSQNGQPPFNPQMVVWWKRQAEAEQLAKSLSDSDRHFIQGVKTRSPASRLPAEAEAPDDVTQEALQ